MYVSIIIFIELSFSDIGEKDYTYQLGSQIIKHFKYIT